MIIATINKTFFLHSHILKAFNTQKHLDYDTCTSNLQFL
jgi:hypothetical protein